MTSLSPRARKILFAVVSEYISTGDPVGSRTLARRYGLELSAATIRNVLADLEEGAFLEQPHTSAGRIPTERAFRLFIDTLLQTHVVSPEMQASLDQRVQEIHAGSDPLRETGRLLSELSGTAAILSARRTSGRALTTLRFIPTKPRQVLAVLVFDDATVENRFVELTGAIPETELVRIHNVLSDLVEGRSLAEVRDLIARRLDDEQTEADQLRRKAFELGRQALDGVDDKAELILEGQTRLLELPEYADAGRLRQVLRALEERQELVQLLDKTLAAGVAMVFVGSEKGESPDPQLSLVIAPFSEHGRAAGAVGVLGPTRMDYAKVMPLVDATAAAMSGAMSGAMSAAIHRKKP